MKRAVVGLMWTVVGCAWGVGGLVGSAGAQDITRVSLDSNGNQANRASGSPEMSADGVWVVFESDAPNLVAGDTGGLWDVFLHNRVTRVTIRVSEVPGSGGVGGDGNSGRPAISADGSTVAFESEARNLVGGDMNGASDVFVYVVVSGVIERASVDDLGVEANGASLEPSVSADGRHVAFYSEARNLSVNDHNLFRDVYVRDRSAGVTLLASVGASGMAGNGNSGYYTAVSISGDGQRVAFSSSADDLVLGDLNGWTDIFVRDLAAITTTRVSVSSSGTEGDLSSRSCAIAGNGRRVVFDSASTNLILADLNSAPDVFVHDLLAGTTTRVSVASDGSEGDSYSRTPAISEDGNTAAYESAATNLVAVDVNGVNDVFAHDMATGATTRLTQDMSGVGGNGSSLQVDLGQDGQSAVFASMATDLVGGDTNGVQDIFVWESGGCGGQAPSNYCISSANSAGAGAVMASAGTTFVANNDFVLVVDGSVPNQFGIFYYGPTQVLFTFGNGYRCVGGSVFRLPPVQADGGGAALYAVDNTNPPQPSGQIVGGSTWNFQFWNRDPGVGQGFNLSDGLEVFFCP